MRGGVGQWLAPGLERAAWIQISAVLLAESDFTQLCLGVWGNSVS